jgi:CheY-like chemotaxis protein
MEPRVLHVDDSEDMRQIVLLALETVGNLEVAQASSGAEALSLAVSFEPDILLLDVMMPEMTGPQTLLNLRKISKFAATPVIFLTAKAQADDVADLMALGALAVMTKPFDPRSLAEQIVKIWEGFLTEVGPDSQKPH